MLYDDVALRCYTKIQSLTSWRLLEPDQKKTEKNTGNLRNAYPPSQATPAWAPRFFCMLVLPCPTDHHLPVSVVLRLFYSVVLCGVNQVSRYKATKCESRRATPSLSSVLGISHRSSRARRPLLDLTFLAARPTIVILALALCAAQQFPTQTLIPRAHCHT